MSTLNMSPSIVSADEQVEFVVSMSATRLVDLADLFHDRLTILEELAKVALRACPSQARSARRTSSDGV